MTCKLCMQIAFDNTNTRLPLESNKANVFSLPGRAHLSEATWKWRLRTEMTWVLFWDPVSWWPCSLLRASPQSCVYETVLRCLTLPTLPLNFFFLKNHFNVQIYFLGFKMDLSFCDSILVMESKFIPWQELRWFLGPGLECGSPLNQSQWELGRGVAPGSSSQCVAF